MCMNVKFTIQTFTHTHYATLNTEHTVSHNVDEDFQSTR